MATGGCEKTSDELFNFKCTPCGELNKTKEAVKYCVQCQGYCCQTCVDTHRVFPTLKGHTLVDKSNLNPQLIAAELPVVPTETCRTHGIKILDMYCENHDVVGCTSCIALDHRSCSDVHLIPDVIDNLHSKSDAGKIHQKLQDMKMTMKEIKTNREALIQRLCKSKTEAENEIRDFGKVMETLLKSLQKESLKEIEEQFRQMKLQLEEEKKGAEDELDILKQAEEGLVKAEGNRAQQFVSLKTAQNIIAQTEEMSRSLRLTNDANISFAPDSTIRNFLLNRKTLGSVNHDVATQVQQRKALYAIKATRESNIKMQNDASSCWVHGSCLTEDGALLMADFSNKTLKRANNVTTPVLDYCNLPDQPYSVCCIGKHEAAVTLTNNTVQFVSLADQMTPTRQIKLTHKCFGIAYKGDKLYITDYGKSLYIYDMTGKVSKNITGNSLFQWSRHIAFSGTGKETFVTCQAKGLINLDVNARHTNTYTASELLVTTGVCSDGRGNLFVCGHGSNNVVQIGQDGNKFGEIVKSSNGLKSPQSLCFNQRTSTLVVTQSDSNIVKLFDLQ
ncbi:uncharacterized protein LOC128556286 [Mercenaria mercenaria]|uniref:uncharacterized protein LOC128556286 n=1 Tax=Mercenaria mercenaria TaxID=6596 RepID=UPI00234EBA42|nr:uncharacterized protein LOC128556286 [Mercenaria mercenaria]